MSVSCDGYEEQFRAILIAIEAGLRLLPGWTPKRSRNYRDCCVLLIKMVGEVVPLGAYSWRGLPMVVNETKNSFLECLWTQ